MGLTCPSGMTVTITSSATLSQAPSGSSVVSVKVITPVKPGSEGVKVALRLLIFEKSPETSEVHVADEAAPPIEPDNCMEVLVQNGS